MTRLLQASLLFTVCSLLASCHDDQPWARGEVDGYAPIYSTEASLKQISFQVPRKTVNGGKLFTAGTLVLQEEIDSGLHVISYQDPAHPIKTGFLRIPGFQVAAIEGDYLYANNYDDLIAIRLKTISADMSVGRVVGIWKQLNYPAGRGVYFECVDPSKGIVVGWRKTKLNNPQCRRPENIYDEPTVLSTRNNAGMIAFHRKLYLVTPDALAVYSLAYPERPVLTRSKALPRAKVDSLFLLNKELAVSYSTQLGRYDTTSLDNISLYDNLSHCLKIRAKGDTAYAIFSRRNLCGSPSSTLIKFRLKKDSTSAAELGRLQVGTANAFVIAGSYIYVAASESMSVVNITGGKFENAGDQFIGGYSDIVNNGNLLFLRDSKQIACYSIATSPASPKLLSQLLY
ncbi:hypothetical protein [Chitinophaga ginsengisoli]|uniref:LVIVD repeat-containing protein n=1 Tax=Chitinophaga ginsengisoli TaxID=363837 RepID=A0A2P8G9U6_9BACT|nr:hypothetical protein [Chitinophaga ginsengisoli]PSL30748.1 hypothetical protein CLV42_105109 [Chitinophaga ginsengisoli]